MRVSKILGYIMVIQILISFISGIAAKIHPEASSLDQVQDMARWAGYLWGYAAMVMGFYLKGQTGRWIEVAGAAFVTALCLVPLWGMLAAFLYFFWAFSRLDKKKNGLPL